MGIGTLFNDFSQSDQVQTLKYIWYSIQFAVCNQMFCSNFSQNVIFFIPIYEQAYYPNG